MSLANIKFKGLTFWPLAQKIRAERSIKPNYEDVEKAIKNIGKMAPAEQLATFIVLGRLYTELKNKRA